MPMLISMFFLFKFRQRLWCFLFVLIMKGNDIIVLCKLYFYFQITLKYGLHSTISNNIPLFWLWVKKVCRTACHSTTELINRACRLNYGISVTWRKHLIIRIISSRKIAGLWISEINELKIRDLPYYYILPDAKI